MSDDPTQVLRYPQLQDEGLADWRFFLMKLHGRFRTGSFVRDSSWSPASPRPPRRPTTTRTWC